jgi:serine/threonine-protein kinase RsbW
MDAECQPLTLTIPSDLRLLAIARGFVREACRVAGLDEATTNAIVLATHEATGNAIRHAHQGYPEAQIQIRCWLHPDTVEIHILDEGAPFDLNSVPNLDPAELRIGGRGVFLMRTLMDELSCHPRGERGNTVRMVKRCGQYRNPRESA